MLFSILSDQNLNGIFLTYHTLFQDIICTSFPHPHKHKLYLDLDVTSHTHHLLCECTHHPGRVDPTAMDKFLNLDNDPEHQVTFSLGLGSAALFQDTACLLFTPEYRYLSVYFVFYSGLQPPYPQTLDILTVKYKLKVELYYLLFSSPFSIFALYPYF